MDPSLRRAGADDLPGIHALLAEAGLPLEGLQDCGPHVWVAELPDSRSGPAGAHEGHGPPLAGAIGFERRGDAGLLRSLVVAPAHRGRGLGLALLRHGVAEMRAARLGAAYGLTTTIPGLLAREGWSEVERNALPPAVMASKELQGACPASALSFRLDLA